MGPLSRYSTQRISVQDISAVVDALTSPWLTQGPAVERFEAELAEFVGAKYSVAVASGTAALHLCALVLKPKAVITSPLTFVATVNAFMMAGASVATGLVDVDRETGLMEIHTGSLLPMRSVVVPVHYAGRAMKIIDMQDMALFEPSVVVEDAAHALGAMEYGGLSSRKVGCCSRSLACCFSFHPVKPITCGEGGAVTTNDQAFADELRALRNHGRDEEGLMRSLGLNYRMDEMSAALGCSQLKRCEEDRQRRLEIAATYAHALEPHELVQHPKVDFGSAHHLFPVRIKGGRRDAVKRALLAEGIGVQVHYLPVHEQPYYAECFGYNPEDFPEAHAWGQEELSLPCHAGMSRGDVATVVSALNRALVEAS